MHHGIKRETRNLVAMAAAAMALIAVATVARGDVIKLPKGGITITGVRYVNGQPSKVKCSASDGNVLDATKLGDRVLQLIYSPACGVWGDTDDNDELVFSGPEANLAVNGTPTNDVVFDGFQVANGPNGSAAAEGMMSGVFKCGAGCSSAKGPIVYHRFTPYADIYFIGSYKAHF